MPEKWTDERFDRLATTVKSISVKLDSFSFESLRLFAKLSKGQGRNATAIAALVTVTNLARSQQKA